jgi:hypothetical protein
MSPRRIALFGVLCIALLFAVATIVKAQAPPRVIPAQGIVSGADLGFRIDGYQGDTPVGTLVVRVNGQWVPVQFGAGRRLQPLTLR